jgi:putative hydrolase of the HAD superfamily
MDLSGAEMVRLQGELASVRAIYFDLDDTLCAYWNASKAALHATFDQHLGDRHAPADMVNHWAETYREFAPLIKSDAWYPLYLVSGDPTRKEHMRRTIARIGLEDDALAATLSATYRIERNTRLELFPDALATLTTLHRHFPLGVMTNGPADIQREELRQLGITNFFSHFFIEGEVGVGKPAMTVFEQAQSAVGLAPEEILMVGNSFGHDIRPAITAGWKTIWLRRDSDVPPSARPGTLPEMPPVDSPQPTAILGELAPLIQLLAR